MAQLIVAERLVAKRVRHLARVGAAGAGERGEGAAKVPELEGRDRGRGFCGLGADPSPGLAKEVVRIGLVTGPLQRSLVVQQPLAFAGIGEHCADGLQDFRMQLESARVAALGAAQQPVLRGEGGALCLDDVGAALALVDRQQDREGDRVQPQATGGVGQGVELFPGPDPGAARRRLALDAQGGIVGAPAEDDGVAHEDRQLALEAGGDEDAALPEERAIPLVDHRRREIDD